MRIFTAQNKENKTLKREYLIPGYIQRKVDGGFIKNKEFPRLLQGIMDTLQLVHEDLWDIQFDWQLRRTPDVPVMGFYTYKFNIIIRFPEFEISNSIGLRTKIQDLFVAIPVEILEDSLRFGNIEGGRTTFTPSEFNKYIHSHISASVPCQYERFCTGTGEINNLVAMLNGMTNTDFDLDLFSLYLMHLNTFVSWESLEGTPYKYISQLLESTGGVKPIENTHLSYYQDILIQHLKDEEHYRRNITWRISDGKYEIIDNYQLEKVLITLLKDVATYYTEDSLFCLKNNKGEYIIQRSLMNMSSIDNSKYLVFRGEKFYQKIVDDFEPLHDPELYVNPSIKNYFKKQLENAANSKAITKSYLKGN